MHDPLKPQSFEIEKYDREDQRAVWLSIGLGFFCGALLGACGMAWVLVRVFSR